MYKRFFLLLVSCSLLFGCEFNSIIDSNEALEGNQWLYTNTAKAEFEVTDTTKTYNLSFKLRINSDYRYANLFVLTTIKDSLHVTRVRHQVKVAKADGEWLGKGSGDLYTYVFPLLKKHRFSKLGKHSVEIEQNMRENPLVGVSDIGILVTKN